MVKGPFDFFEGANWGSFINPHITARELNVKGHWAEHFSNPNEEEMVGIFNNHSLVFIFAHGPGACFVDKEGKPVGGFLLGGTEQNPIEPVASRWVTARELDGRVHNNVLEVAAGSCNSATNRRLYQAIGPAVFAGAVGTPSSGIGVQTLDYILNRANGMPFSLAKKEFLSTGGASRNFNLYGANVLP